MIIVSIIIFVVCMLIEFIRQIISKKIQNLRLIIKLKDKYYNFTKNIFFNREENIK